MKVDEKEEKESEPETTNCTHGTSLKKIVSMTFEDPADNVSIFSDERFKLDFDTAIKTPILEVPEVSTISDDNISQLFVEDTTLKQIYS